MDNSWTGISYALSGGTIRSIGKPRHPCFSLASVKHHLIDAPKQNSPANGCCVVI